MDKVKIQEIAEEAKYRAEDHLLDLLLPGVTKASPKADKEAIQLPDTSKRSSESDAKTSTREKFRKMLREGKLDDREIEITTSQRKSAGIEVLTGGNMNDIQSAMNNIGNIFGSIMFNLLIIAIADFAPVI